MAMPQAEIILQKPGMGKVVSCADIGIYGSGWGDGETEGDSALLL